MNVPENITPLQLGSKYCKTFLKCINGTEYYVTVCNTSSGNVTSISPAWKNGNTPRKCD
jgi:hypothetical protein